MNNNYHILIWGKLDYFLKSVYILNIKYLILKILCINFSFNCVLILVSIMC